LLIAKTGVPPPQRRLLHQRLRPKLHTIVHLSFNALVDTIRARTVDARLIRELVVIKIDAIVETFIGSAMDERIRTTIAIISIAEDKKF